MCRWAFDEIVPKHKIWKLERKGKFSTSLHVSVCTACESVLDMVRRVCRTLFQVRDFILWFWASVLDPLTTTIGISHGLWCDAQKLWRVSPSEYPRIIRCWVDMVCYSQHWLWFQKVSFNAAAPLRWAVNINSIEDVVRRLSLSLSLFRNVTFLNVRIVIHLPCSVPLMWLSGSIN